jgi:hypothetical protein
MYIYVRGMDYFRQYMIKFELDHYFTIFDHGWTVVAQ